MATVKWIGIRPERRAPVQSCASVFADKESGLTGDHSTKPHRQVTLISYEALQQVAERLRIPIADPAKARRNTVISGLDFDLDSGVQIKVGNALLEITGPCLPCERMEENFGEGGRLAMANAGGLTARILDSGPIALGDEVEVIRQSALSASNV